MLHKNYLVDLVDERGNITGQKSRKNINKQTDLYNAVFVLLVTPGKKFVLSQIPDRQDLPNIYAHRLGATTATIRRHSESANQAAKRVLADELEIHQVALKELGHTYAILADGRKTYMSLFTAIAETPQNYSKKDIAGLSELTAHQLNTALDQTAKIAPTLKHIWQAYQAQLSSS